MKTRLFLILTFAGFFSLISFIPYGEAERIVFELDQMTELSDAIAIGTVQSTWIDIRLSDNHPIVDTAKIKVDDWLKNNKNSDTLEIRYYGYWAKTIDDLRGKFIFDNPLFTFESGQKILLMLDHEENTAVMGGGYYPLFEGSFVINDDVAISLAGEQLTLQSLYEDIGNNIDKKNESKEDIKKEHVDISLYKFKPSISVDSPINNFTIKLEGYYPKPHAPDIQIVNETGHVIWTNYDDIGHVTLGRTGSVDFCNEYQFYDIGDPIIFNSTGIYKFIFTFEEFSLAVETSVRQNTAGGTIDNPNFHCD